MKITVTINGKQHSIEIEAGERLLDMIRKLGLWGTKFGCGEGDCGACTVLLDGKPVNSCLVLAARVDGHEILTIEGLGTPDNPHPLQTAFAELGAVQCGYSTPGTILAAYALLQTNPNPTDDDIKQAIDGNLCRCTGYVKRIEAIKRAVAIVQEESK